MSHSQQQPAQDGLKIVDNPGGGQVVYGSLNGPATQAKAMAFMLSQVHGHFGDRPQVGKLFQSKDGGQLAAFFTLTAKKQGGKPIAGLVIVTMPAGQHAHAAVLYDDLKRFPSTEPAMMKSISAMMGSAPHGGGQPAQPAPAPAGGAEPLHMVTTGDHSAAVGLPQGWWLDRVSGGQLVAEGPRGEMVSLGLLFQGIVDPRGPQAQMWMNRPASGGGRPLVYQMGGDLFTAYTNVFNQIRQHNNKSTGTFSLIRSTPLSDGGSPTPIQAIFTVDLHDGKGPRKASARIGELITRGAPMWAMTVSSSNIPEQYADAENATLMAVIHSYRQDAKVIGQESAGDMARIQAVAEQVKIQVKAADDRRVASSQAYEAHSQQLRDNDKAQDDHMANIDWQSKVTQDYILDRSVVRDTEDDAHGTTSNKFADFLVKANPNRFEIVQNQDLIRGWITRTSWVTRTSVRSCAAKVQPALRPIQSHR